MNFPFYIQCFYVLAKNCFDYIKAQKIYSYFPLEAFLCRPVIHHLLV